MLFGTYSYIIFFERRYFLMKKTFKEIKQTLDVNKKGGAVLLGCKKIVVKCHGSSKAFSIKEGIKQVVDAYNANLCSTIENAVAKLEKDCGFSNGYLNPKKMTKLPYDRAVLIARYLHVTPQEVLTGELPTEVEASDILDQVDIAFYGEFKELDQEQQETVRDMVRLMRQRKANRLNG